MSNTPNSSNAKAPEKTVKVVNGWPIKDQITALSFEQLTEVFKALSFSPDENSIRVAVDNKEEFGSLSLDVKSKQLYSSVRGLDSGSFDVSNGVDLAKSDSKAVNNNEAKTSSPVFNDKQAAKLIAILNEALSLKTGPKGNFAGKVSSIADVLNINNPGQSQC